MSIISDDLKMKISTQGIPLALQGGAVKADAGKADFSLLPLAALEGVARVLEFGAKKYSRGNWKKGMSHSRLLAACMRHLAYFQDGDRIDEESYLPHLDHALCCLIFLRYHQIKSLGTDDLDE